MQNSDFQLRKRATSLALSAGLFAICTGLAWGQSAQAKQNAASGDSKSVEQTVKILILGDSLSAEYGLKRGTGWVSHLQSALDRVKTDSVKMEPTKTGRSATTRKRYLIQNASISGETTAGGRSRLPDLLSRSQPDIVIVELGGNDALRGLDLAMTESNLREITQKAKKSGARVLLLGMQIPPNFGKAYAEKFAGVFSKIAQSEKSELVPFLLEGIADDLKYFQADRIHPTEAAQETIMKNVYKGLKTLL
jgi:acyl-CoA thioesterase I